MGSTIDVAVGIIVSVGANVAVTVSATIEGDGEGTREGVWLGEGIGVNVEEVLVGCSATDWEANPESSLGLVWHEIAIKSTTKHKTNIFFILSLV